MLKKEDLGSTTLNDDLIHVYSQKELGCQL